MSTILYTGGRTTGIRIGSSFTPKTTKFTPGVNLPHIKKCCIRV